MCSSPSASSGCSPKTPSPLHLMRHVSNALSSTLVSGQHGQTCPQSKDKVKKRSRPKVPYLVLIAVGVCHNPVPPVQLDWRSRSLIDNAHPIHEYELAWTRAVGQEGTAEEINDLHV